MKIQQYKFEKVVIEEKDWEVPTTPQYYFETFIRRSICVIPLWTTWNKEHYNKEEEIYALDIICVYQSFQDKIEKFNILISQIETRYAEKNEKGDIVRFLIDIADDEFVRTEQQFKNDFDTCLAKIKDNFIL